MNHGDATPDSPEARFDRVASNWDQRPTSQQLAVIPGRLLARVPFGSDDHVLDFGAGTGLLSTAIAPHAARVTALDTSAGMLDVLRGKGLANIETLHGNIFRNAPSGPFDAVVSCMAMHHVEDTARLLYTLTGILRPGGRLALVDLYAEDGSFHGDNPGKGVHHFGFAPEALRAQAQAAGLCDIAFEEILRIRRSNRREYPLFLMTARSPAR